MDYAKILKQNEELKLLLKEELKIYKKESFDRDTAIRSAEKGWISLYF